ncbi:acyl-CoA dehydrogenase family protein [Leekyejoonella antrihumi]|uniref:Acyl-CoA dehydrogenase n=1 Tax=Leekyejoonella antrihumi TaxID=1660198 RepID=A0A563DYU1_9MICO|nr:acyl-CoA dehydrogenase family protein [Leekyejoonella antrihumi]TWP35428.1 acyl-CoA dehydrogenase [Leekyejoonella antrihumi]
MTGTSNAYALTPSQRDYIEHVRRVAREHLLDIPAVHGGVNRPLIRALGEHGLLRGLFGGRPDEPAQDAAALQLCLLRETLATVTTEAETALALQGLGSYPILQSGSAQVVERWIPGVIDGSVVAAFALSEADAGSDAAALSLEARPTDGGWQLHGEKCWISNAPEADVYTVFARTTPGAGSRGVTAFVVPGDAPGLTGESLDMVAPHALGTLTFDDVRVTTEDVLGEVDAGFRVAMRTLDLFRPSVGAFTVGMAQAALDAAVRWSCTRQVYGDRLVAQQSVAHTLAEMATRIEGSRLLVRAAATAYDSGAPREQITSAAAMAKLFATESAQWVVDQSVQLHGARGLQKGHLLERLYREVRAPRIYEGASEVQRTIIGRGLIRAYDARPPHAEGATGGPPPDAARRVGWHTAYSPDQGATSHHREQHS